MGQHERPSELLSSGVIWGKRSASLTGEVNQASDQSECHSSRNLPFIHITSDRRSETTNGDSHLTKCIYVHLIIF